MDLEALRREEAVAGPAAVLEHLPVAVVAVDGGGRIRYANPAAEGVYGCPVAQLLGRTPMEVAIAPEHRDTAAAVLDGVLGGEPWRGPFPLRRADGSAVVAWFDAAPLRDRDGTVSGALWVCREAGTDVQGERSARLEAESANRLLEAVLANAPIGLAFFDADARFVLVNEAIAEINGVPVPDHFGRRVGELLPAMDSEVEPLVRQVFSTGEPIVSREVIGETPAEPGVERRWLASYYPVSVDGRTRWVGVIVVEVTEWRAAETQRLEALAAQRRARASAEQAAERVARLQDVTARLAAARTAADVAVAVCDHGSAGLGAITATVYLATIDGTRLELLRHSGASGELVERFRRATVDDDLPVSEVLRTGESRFFESPEQFHARYPALKGARTSSRAFAAIPLPGDDAALGVITFGFPSERRFDAADRRFLAALAGQAAQALRRVWLDEAERAARRRQEFLAEASRLLASSLDERETLQAVTRRAVPGFGDSCSVHLALPDDELRMVAGAHGDPGREQVMHALASRDGGVTTNPFVRRVAATGRPVFAPHVAADAWPAFVQDRNVVALLAELDVASALGVALRARDQVLGVLVVTRGRHRTPFDTDDLALATDLADRAAVAVDNARAHRARSEVARTLQASLLPPHLPRIPGVALAARYDPVGDGSLVGGDFYDVFPTGGDRWAVVMGDVCGQGVPAASLTALVRYTVRAAARQWSSPADVLRFTNDAMIDHDLGERFCTAVVGVVEPGAGGLRLTVACAGHPLPLVMEASGAIRTVGRAGTALGLIDEPELADVAAELQPGDRLLLYTDGVVEARTPAGEFVPDDFLPGLLQANRGAGAETLASIVEQAVLQTEGGRARDDIALLVAEVLGGPTDTGAARHRGEPIAARFAAEPMAVGEARRAVAGWLDELNAPPGDVDDVLLAVTELATNAVKAARTSFEVRAWAGDDALYVEVADDGLGFDPDVPSHVHDLDPLAENGRGLFLASTVLDECVVDSGPNGTVVRGIKRRR